MIGWYIITLLLLLISTSISHVPRVPENRHVFIYSTKTSRANPIEAHFILHSYIHTPRSYHYSQNISPPQSSRQACLSKIEHSTKSGRLIRRCVPFHLHDRSPYAYSYPISSRPRSVLTKDENSCLNILCSTTSKSRHRCLRSTPFSALSAFTSSLSSSTSLVNFLSILPASSSRDTIPWKPCSVQAKLMIPRYVSLSFT